MASTRKIIRAFLASPGDLQDERKAIKDAVHEFNESWANRLGYQVELLGWEETVASYGRPQHLINQELDSCELFLGMIWKKWGTPPDSNGHFSSGFEEEFKRSVERREKTGSPEISMFFKQVPSEFMVDPGEDLKKVLEFRDNIIAGKQILYQSFSSTHDMEKLLRKCLSTYVWHVKNKDEPSEVSDLGGKRNEDTDSDAIDSESSPLSPEGFRFLDELVKRIKKPDSLHSLSASEIARFRLLAYSVSKSGNDEIDLGVHDINMLYSSSIEGTELGERELRSLTRLGFKNLNNENVPLWRWYSELADSPMDPAIISSVAGSDESEKVGAISVLTRLAFDLSTNKEGFKRDRIIGSWFLDVSPTRVRIAGLEYLAKCGTLNDLDIAKEEYSKTEYGTSRNALECMVEILLRTGQMRVAQELVIESQFVTFRQDLLSSLLSGFEELDSNKLLIGLEHRNSELRLHALKALFIREELDVDMAERLTRDSEAIVRWEALKILLKFGKPLSEEDIKEILIQPQKQAKAGLLGIASVRDSSGEENFRQYQLDALKPLNEAELQKRVKSDPFFEDAAYFTLVDKYFKNHANQLRQNIDDRFKAYIEEKIQQIKIKFGDDSETLSIIKGMKNLEDFIRKELTRKALDVLCVKQKPEDLQRIRLNLREGYAGASILDAEYLAKNGDWTDIPLLANSTGPMIGKTLLTLSDNDKFHLAVAKALTLLGKKHSVSDLLLLKMPELILVQTIQQCSESRFKQISHDAVMTLFNHESEAVRKSAVLMAIRAFSSKRINSLLQEYVGSDDYRYYNVIHWLDLGASMTRSQAKTVVTSLDWQPS